MRPASPDIADFYLNEPHFTRNSMYRTEPSGKSSAEASCKERNGWGQGVIVPWPSFYMPPFFFLLFFFAIFRTVKSYDVYRCCIIHLRSQACSNNNRFPELDFRPSRFWTPRFLGMVYFLETNSF